MKLGLQLNLQQKLAPQLIQSLKMLQMPVLKLEQTIRQELSVNPMLEEVDPVEEDTQDSDQDEELDLGENEPSETERELAEWEDYFDDEEGYKVKEPRESVEDRFEQTTSSDSNLYNHLLDQLNLLKLSEKDHLIGEYIIGNISPDGYLTISVPEMAQELKELNVSTEDIERVLEQVKRFDPTGVGSSDLRESLLVQLEEQDQKDSLAWRIVDEHIHELDRKSILQIAKLMGVPVEKAQQAMSLIKNLSPTPAHGRFDTGAQPVVPDLIVERYGDDFVVYHNDRYMPRLRVNPAYRDLVKRRSKANRDTKKYIRQKLEQARWLLNAINQRRTTMIRVMEAIIKRQREFFEKGPAFLKPLIMDDIAQAVGMNVATISRVSSGKYVQTPLGVFEIKYFFNTGISQENGEDMSKRSVKQRIEDIISKEDPAKPHSDQEIYKILNSEGIKLARRTVTKYREELKLPPARLRKRVESTT